MRFAWAVLPWFVACAGPALQVRTWDILVPPADAAPAEAAASPSGFTLRVDPFVADGDRDAYEILSRHESHELVPDPARRWARRPSAYATDAVISTLRNSGGFVGVATPGAEGPRSDLTLRGEVLAFEETAAGAEVRLVATLAPRDERLHPPTPVRLTGRGRVAFDGADPADRAGAMERALAEAAALLTAAVVDAADAYGRIQVDRTPEPARLDLVVPPADVGSLPSGLAVRVERIDAPTSLDRLELLERRVQHRVVSRPDISWTKRPSEVVADALADTLRRALGADGRLLRSGRARTDEVGVEGRLRRFELDTTVSPAAARVELEVTVDGRSEVLVGDRVPAGSGADELAAAFAAAVGEAVAGVPTLVAAVDRTPSVTPPARAAPIEQFLVLEPAMPAAGEVACDGTLGVARLSGGGGGDRLELLHRDGRHVVELDRVLRWQQRPAFVVTDGLIRALDASKAFPAGVLGPGAPEEPAFSLSGTVERFEFEDVEGERAAVVSLRLELRRAAAVTRLVAHGSAPVGQSSPAGLAAAMSRALAVALDQAVTEVAGVVRRAARSESP